MKRVGKTDVARLAEEYARESGVDQARIVLVDAHYGYALAAVDCGNTADSLR